MSDRNRRRRPSPLFRSGMSLVKLCDLPDNLLTYVVADDALYVVATQWGDHKFVGENTRDELLAELLERTPIEQ